MITITATDVEKYLCVRCYDNLGIVLHSCCRYCLACAAFHGLATMKPTEFTGIPVWIYKAYAELRAWATDTSDGYPPGIHSVDLGPVGVGEE